MNLKLKKNIERAWKNQQDSWFLFHSSINTEEEEEMFSKKKNTQEIHSKKNKQCKNTIDDDGKVPSVTEDGSLQR